MRYDITLDVTYDHFKTFDANSRETSYITEQIAGYVQAGREGTLYDVHRNIVGKIVFAKGDNE